MFRNVVRDGFAPRFWRRGHVLIGCGLLLILAAQFWTILPAVTAIALIGRGAVLTLHSQPRSSRQDTLVMLNLSIYGVLVCLAIVGQSNAILQSPAEPVRLGMLLDHAGAIVLMAGLIGRVFYRLSQPAS